MTGLNGPVPDGWTSATIGDLLEIKYGKGLPARDRVPGGVPVYSSAGHTGEHNVALAQGPVLVIARKGVGVGDVVLAPEPCWVIDTALYAEVPDGMDAEYLLWVLRACELASLDKSSAIPSLSRSDMERISVPLAPVVEQKRIAAAISECTTTIESGTASFRSALTGVDEYFVAVAHRELIEPSYPDTTLEDVAEIAGGLTKGRRLKEDPHRYPFLRAANVRDGALDLSEVKEIEATPAELAKFSLRRGDVLLVEGSGSPDRLGTGWLWDGQVEPCLHQNHVFRARPNTSMVRPRFLAWVLRAPRTRHYFRSVAKTTSGLATINKRQVAAMPVPLPPLKIQDQIVERLDAAARSIETARACLLNQLDAAARLHRAAVYQAVTGRLGTRDTRDEPAVELLERTLVARFQARKAKKGRRMVSAGRGSP